MKKIVIICLVSIFGISLTFGQESDSNMVLPDSSILFKVPFYKNEFSLIGGILGEDNGGAFIYENRFTRSIFKRLGISAGVNLMRGFETYDGFLPQAYNSVTVYAGIRLVPLKSRRHSLSLTPALNFMHLSGIMPSFGSTYSFNGGVLVTTSADIENTSSFGYQLTIEYTFLPTYHIPVGIWLRAADNRAYDSFASFGFHIGYRF
jgi:hypothetical protein